MNDAKYIGMDVHQATISVVILNSIGHLVMESILETKAAAILQRLHGLSGSLHVTFEEETCAAWLYDLLKHPLRKLWCVILARMPCSKLATRMTASTLATWLSTSFGYKRTAEILQLSSART